MFLKNILVFIGVFSLATSLQIVSGAGFSVSTNPESALNKLKKQQIEYILTSRKLPFSYPSLNVSIDSTQTEPRGFIKGTNLTVSSLVKSDSEFIKLFTHELGHYVDIYSLPQSSVGDISDEFYAISWADTYTKHSSEKLSSFVSGYASTNKYEDFAESFVWYIFHNVDFADRALKNESLRQKYLFFQKNVFSSGEFAGTDYSVSTEPSYLWDTTKIAISAKKYLYSIQ